MAGRVVVIGAGIGGLAAGLDLVSHGAQVTILERAAAPGGKLRQIAIGDALIDAGPTVFTMRSVFEELFASAGARLEDYLQLHRTTTLARHGWPDGSRLDLYADPGRSADAIHTLSGARDANGYRRFAEDARRTFETLDAPFMRSARPSLPALIARIAAVNPGNLWRIQPYATLWSKLGEYFRDPRLRQLFGRYATYCGSSPFLSPATLMLVAHVEREGVWLIEGGMRKLADALATLFVQRGGAIRYNAHVEEIALTLGRASGVRLAGGETVPAHAVVCNADANAVANGSFGSHVAGALPGVPPRGRSLSAMTWAMLAKPSGFPLLRHNVLFSDDYAREFSDIFTHQRMPAAPTIYVCAQDRSDRDSPRALGEERLFCIMNAPANGDTKRYDPGEADRCADTLFGALSRCGLQMDRNPEAMTVTTPTDFNTIFPGSGGALYGRASHGWMASFQRAQARSRIPGLYLAGGTTHPGTGLPMATLSGRLAAAALRADLGLPKRSNPAAMPGGISTA